MINTIIEQLCYGVICNQSSLTNAKRLAFISIDGATMTAISGFIMTEFDNDNPLDFNSMLELIEKKNKITKSEKEDISKFHNIRKNLFSQPEILVMDYVTKYVSLLKILLAHLYHYRASKSEWEKMVEKYRKNLSVN